MDDVMEGKLLRPSLVRMSTMENCIKHKREYKRRMGERRRCNQIKQAKIGMCVRIQRDVQILSSGCKTEVVLYARNHIRDTKRSPRHKQGFKMMMMPRQRGDISKLRRKGKETKIWGRNGKRKRKNRR